MDVCIDTTNHDTLAGARASAAAFQGADTVKSQASSTRGPPPGCAPWDASRGERLPQTADNVSLHITWWKANPGPWNQDGVMSPTTGEDAHRYGFSVYGMLAKRFRAMDEQQSHSGNDLS